MDATSRAPTGQVITCPGNGGNFPVQVQAIAGRRPFFQFTPGTGSPLYMRVMLTLSGQLPRSRKDSLPQGDAAVAITADGPSDGKGRTTLYVEPLTCASASFNSCRVDQV